MGIFECPIFIFKPDTVTIGAQDMREMFPVAKRTARIGMTHVVWLVTGKFVEKDKGCVRCRGMGAHTARPFLSLKVARLQSWFLQHVR